jgi:hypothetical protein
VFQRQLGTEGDHVGVRGAQRHVHEGQRVEHGMRRGVEARQHGLAGQLRGTRAIRMSAHAVEHGHECDRVIHCGGDAVLVLFTRTDEGDFRQLELQNRPPGRFS